MSKRLKQLQLEPKKYHTDYKQSKSLIKCSNCEIFIAKHLPTKRRHLSIRILVTKDAQLNELKSFMEIYLKLKDYKCLSKMIGYVLLSEARKGREKCLVIVYEFVELSLYDLITYSKCKNKEESLAIVHQVCQGYLQMIRQIESVQNVDLNCVSFDSKLIGYNHYTASNQQLKFIYLPPQYATSSTAIFQKQFKRQIYSARQLRLINKLQGQHHHDLITDMMDVDNIILQSQRETEDQNYNRQVLQKIGLFSLKLLYILCQELEIKEEEFNLYTMNEKFIIDFNWILINEFLEECYKHRDYVEIAKIIHYLVADCREENSFSYYQAKINEIKSYVKEKSPFYTIDKKDKTGTNIQEQVESRHLNSSNRQQRPKIHIFNIKQLAQQLQQSSKEDNILQLQHAQQQLLTNIHNQQTFNQQSFRGASVRRSQISKNSELNIQEHNYSVQKLHDLLNNSSERQKIRSHRQSANYNHDHRHHDSQMDYNNNNNNNNSLFKQTQKGKKEISFNVEQEDRKRSSMKRLNMRVKLKEVEQYILNNDKINEIKYEDGSKYVGQFNGNGMRSGLGIYYFAEGQIYGGEWENNQMTGKGIYLFVNEDEVYEGQVKNGIKSGLGVYYYKNGNEYDGYWDNDAKQGYGQLKDYHSGQVYCGQFKINHKHGRGKIIYHDGTKFEGNFISGMRHGQGLFYDQDNRLYMKSFWKNDTMQNYAEIFFHNGDYYNGQILNNFMHGKGIFKYIDGTVFQGQFVDNLPSGLGHIHYENGDRYEGKMVMGNLYGRGRYTYVNDNLIYDGDWKMNKQTGQGQYLFNNHQRLICTMKNGEVVKYAFHNR